MRLKLTALLRGEMTMLSPAVCRATPTLVMLAIGSLVSETHAAAGSFQVRQQAADSLAQARALYLQNKVGEALPIFQAVATNEPKNAEAHAWLAEAARRLGVTQPRVSDLMRGRIDLFSIDTLIDMLARFGIRVRLVFKRSERSTQVA